MLGRFRLTLQRRKSPSLAKGGFLYGESSNVAAVAGLVTQGKIKLQLSSVIDLTSCPIKDEDWWSENSVVLLHSPTAWNPLSRTKDPTK